MNHHRFPTVRYKSGKSVRNHSNANGTTPQEVLPYNIYSQYGDLLFVSNKKTTRIVDVEYELNECYYCTTSPQGKVLFETVSSSLSSSSPDNSNRGTNETATSNATVYNSTNGTSAFDTAGQSSASTGDTIEHCNGLFRMCQIGASAGTTAFSNESNATYYNQSDSTSGVDGSGDTLAGGCSVANDHYAVCIFANFGIFVRI